MNKSLLKLIFLLSTILLFQTAQAEESTSGWWIGTFAKKQISSQFSGWMETQIRNNFETGDVSQILYRTGLLYKTNEDSKHEWGLLLAYIQSDANLERRYTLQHSYTYFKTENSKLSHRMRVEGRDFANTGNNAFRFRYLLRYSKNLGKLPAILWNEAFVNLSDEDDRGQDAFERNRLFLGTRFSVGSTQMEVGYLNQFVPRPSLDTMEHLVVAYWFF